MKIFKYQIDPDKPSSIVCISKGGKVLSAKVIRNKAYIWALVNPNNPVEDRKILSWVTGKETPRGIEGTKFIDTLVLDDGGYVCHIFAV